MRNICIKPHLTIDEITKRRDSAKHIQQLKRWQVIWFAAQGGLRTEAIARSVGIPQRTVSNWISLYNTQGPQAYVLKPESAIAIAEAIVRASTPVAAGRNAALTAVRMLREAQSGGRLKIHPRELSWLDRIEKTVETIPENDAEFISEMMARVDTTRFVPADYDL